MLPFYYVNSAVRDAAVLWRALIYDVEKPWPAIDRAVSGIRRPAALNIRRTASQFRILTIGSSTKWTV